MTTYLIRRALLMIPTLLGITFLVFMIVALAPGGIGAALAVGTGGTLQASSGVAIQQAYLEDRYGLSDPVVVQYGRWLGRISPVKFGTRDQVLPKGALVRPPKPIEPPPLWAWFTDKLPETPAAAPTQPGVPEFVDDAAKDRFFRKLDREAAEARYELLAAVTTLRAQAVAYARAAGMGETSTTGPRAVDRSLKPIYTVLEKAGPNRDLPEFAPLEKAGRDALAAFSKAKQAREALAAFFSTRAFPQAGVPIIPGVLSLAAPDLGTSFSKSRPSAELIAEHLPVTLLLNLVAIPIIYMVAVPSGMLAAIRRGSFLDVGLGTLYVGLYSFPVVLAGVLSIGYLASSEFLQAFPASGLHDNDHRSMLFLPSFAQDGSFQRGWLLDLLWHMGLPVMCLVYTGFAVLSKQTRAAMLENMNADYVRTAKAKGVPFKDVILRHVFRNSLIPLITIFVTIFPAMLAGSVVVERIFSIRGMGNLVIESINLRDAELILANTVIIAVVNLAALLLADILYALADPRVTYD
jgi:peptide/nickel transport system permease protein